jgi:hypothetical protein
MLKILCISFLMVSIVVSLSDSCQVSISETLVHIYSAVASFIINDVTKSMSDNEVSCTFQEIAMLLVSVQNLHVRQRTST